MIQIKAQELYQETLQKQILNALKEISETHNRTNVAINVGVNVVTNEEKIILHEANKNGCREVID